MRWLRSVVREIVGLFVDDGSFAVAILVWLVLVVHVLGLLVMRRYLLGPVLFGGLAVVLIESVIRFVWRRK